MSTLLDLSRELRDLIYTGVLCDELPAPSIADLLKDYTLTRWAGTEEDMGIYSVRSVQPVYIASSALLLVNRQIYVEFSHIISLAKKNKLLQYKLDCVLWGEDNIYTTWLSVPALSPCVATIEVNLRFYGDTNALHAAWHDDAFSGNPNRYNLWSLLRQSLKSGPAFLSNPRRAGVKVGVLVLNIVTPSQSELDDFRRLRSLFPLVEETGALPDDSRLWDSDAVLVIVEFDMSGFLSPLMPDWYGFKSNRTTWAVRSTLHEKVGVISIRVDREEKRVFDLQTMASQST